MAQARSESVQEAPRELAYSARLVRPFVRVLRTTGKIPPSALAELDALDLDRRMPLEMVHSMLEGAVALTGDAAIGLKAARECSPGDGGILDYAISSASSVQDAVETAVRYVRLVNDALELRFEVVGGDAILRVENNVELPRAALDYQIGAMYRAFAHLWASGAGRSLRVRLSYAAPDDTSEHAATFAGALVEFGAAFSGFVFDSASLAARLASADSRLHDVIVRQAETMLEELPRARPLTERVRSALLVELGGGNPSVTTIAPRLHMSPRTLERRLEREGTTFSALLDDLRKRLALRHVADVQLELAEIAFLLGFSQTTAFHRAFKRWTGQTPLNYRLERKAERNAS